MLTDNKEMSLKVQYIHQRLNNFVSLFVLTFYLEKKRL